MRENLVCLDYMPHYKCKCGECRNTCCKLWQITLSQDEYYNLLGLECSEKLREKLDHSFYILTNPTPSRFASVSLNYFGNCPLIDEDGYCMLQKEKGEKVLPQICRQYPRCKRKVNQEEITLTNSCEMTLELLYRQKTPLKLISIEIDDEFINEEEKSLDSNQMEIRKHCIELMQNRNFAVGERIVNIGKYLSTFEDFDFNSSFYTKEFFAYVKELNNRLGGKSFYLSEYVDHANEFFKDKNYDDALELKDKLFNDYPDMMIFFENIMVNHIFYQNFPYSEQLDSFENEYTALKSTYGWLVYLITGNSDLLKELNEIVDLIAFAFRIIEHTSFYYNCIVIKKQMFAK